MNWKKTKGIDHFQKGSRQTNPLIVHLFNLMLKELLTRSGIDGSGTMILNKATDI